MVQSSGDRAIMSRSQHRYVNAHRIMQVVVNQELGHYISPRSGALKAQMLGGCIVRMLNISEVLGMAYATL